MHRQLPLVFQKVKRQEKRKEKFFGEGVKGRSLSLFFFFFCFFKKKEKWKGLCNVMPYVYGQVSLYVMQHCGDILNQGAKNLVG
jgi:hypothetical protein